MNSQTRQPSQQLVSAAWRHAEQAAATAIGLGATAEQVFQHCQAILAQLPDPWQRQVVNQLALARRKTRGSATTSGEAGIDGAAKPPGPLPAALRIRAAAADPGPPRGFESLAGVEVRPR